MSQRYCQINILMFLVILLIVVGGHLLNNHSQVFLACKSAQEWEVVNQPGRLFEMAHIVIILFGAIQAERVFYSIPHKMGYFEPNTKDMYDYYREEESSKSTPNTGSQLE